MTGPVGTGFFWQCGESWEARDVESRRLECHLLTGARWLGAGDWRCYETDVDGHASRTRERRSVGGPHTDNVLDASVSVSVRNAKCLTNVGPAAVLNCDVLGALALMSVDIYKTRPVISACYWSS